ncbi:glycosyltransferase [Flavobacterium psychrophilum]|uniref:glycosyltransferase n=1 Tax=Flavobacterium psychrophilum TaxID=96345 RepID=UPI00090BAF60|nr:glycosyltransferase [Flavobacterium psychrophilum]EKT2072609.1 glycosyltransferase [Flavobacterium psychrophilum]EKT4492122.1 glycosyltransferase [Flavobacterium psychrophilum]SHH93210.1 Glycosyl transferase, group 1 family protein [Flavobacterium psychrophilum]
MQTKTIINSHRILSTRKLLKKVSQSILPEILFITSYPPRECGIATYSQDLISALNNKFKKSFDIKICALEHQNDNHIFPSNVDSILETDNQNSYLDLAEDINQNQNISMVLIQHEFGLFKTNENDFIEFLKSLNKPIIVVFHTVLPNPDNLLKENVQKIDKIVENIIVMTQSSAKLLINDYAIEKQKIAVIPHGTHLVVHTNKDILKEKYNFSGRKIVSTFGLLSSGKCIETSINALREILKKHPEVLFLVIGKTHPNVVKTDGEKYRDNLEARITALQLNKNVKFINQYLPLNELLEYLQLTDIYLFTSKDRNQAVSGTFSYAISCGCPIISTPIPHAVEVLENGTGIIIDFENPKQLAEQVNILLDNELLRKEISSNGIHKLAPTAWENSAIAHALLFEKISDKKIELHYKIPTINLNHFKNLTTKFGMIQFSVINQPDSNSGYTLDDNARALVVMCQNYEMTGDIVDLEYINLYFKFIKFCLQPEGFFLNYVDINKTFTKQNSENLADSNGRAIWALGYLISISHLLPKELADNAKKTFQLSLSNVDKIYSPRSMAFIIKGIYYSNTKNSSVENILILKHLADKLVQMYKHETDKNWHWFESYLTYGNSILSEAMLFAYLATDTPIYKEIAKTSFDFLLSKIFNDNIINVISNKGWLYNNKPYEAKKGGEQPIDVAYTILALSKFYETFNQEDYLEKMEIAFDWFLGKNHLQQIIYNPSTGGCYDGLEDTYINLNQGAESTVSYLMARLTIEKYLKKLQQNNRKKNNPIQNFQIK